MVSLDKCELSLLRSIKSSPDLAEAFDEFNLDKVYETISSDVVDVLTTILYKLNIDPLAYVTELYYTMYSRVPYKICPHTINVPSTVKSLHTYAFSGNYSIESVSLPETITKIRESAFKDCIDLQHVELSDKVAVIDRFAFSGCGSLSQVGNIKNECILPNECVIIGRNAFKGCAFETLVINENLTSIGQEAFANEYLKHVYVIGENYATIRIAKDAFVFDNLDERSRKLIQDLSI